MCEEHVSEIWGFDELSRLIWKSRKLQSDVLHHG